MLCVRLFISIHAPVKDATFSRWNFAKPTIYFNPRTREGCDLTSGRAMTLSIDFNPRTREGCDFGFWLYFRSRSYFNPRTREGCDISPSNINPCSFISIHAPVKDATILSLDWEFQFLISIHAPVKDATVLLSLVDDEQWHFNPRTREGCDFLSTAHRFVLTNISIHAPVKDATKANKVCDLIFKISIHAPVKDATFQILFL